MAPRPNHTWITSTLGHGDVMCSHCKITNWEAISLRQLDGPCIQYFPAEEPVDGVNQPPPLRGGRS